MIGQENNKNFIKNCLDNNKLPRFIVIRGDKGSGKRTFVHYIADTFKYDLVEFDTKVDSVRNLITLCYQQTKPIIYTISDCEQLSIQAENALLKIAEEPPTNAYIILTVNDDSLLPTIKSRACLIVMEDYTYNEKKQYVKTLDITTDIEDKIDLCDTLGDLLQIANENYDSISELCNNIINNINKASIGSVLKISTKLKLKEKTDDPTLFNLQIFIKVLLYKYYKQCVNHTKDTKNYMYYFKCWETVFHAKKKLQQNLNKQYIVEDMLLKLREIY